MFASTESAKNTGTTIGSTPLKKTAKASLVKEKTKGLDFQKSGPLSFKNGQSALTFRQEHI